MSQIEVKVPDIGDFKEVEVIELLVKPGDTVQAEQSLITVESDKASMEIPSSASGIVKELKVKLGDKVAEGSLVLLLEVSEGAAALAPAATAVPASAPAAPTAPAVSASAAAAASASILASTASAVPVTAVPATTAPANIANAAESNGQKPHASPSVRKFARELGVDLARVSGSGPKGRILIEDVQGFVKGVMAGGAGVSATSSGGAALGL
ncbi:MAG: biotin/lipoyl-containing protein, partial [Betaproteobacteria bacterium]